MLISLLKLQNKMYRMKIIFIARIIQKIIRIIYSCDISYKFFIPEKFYLAHSGLGVVIHRDAQIGKNVLIGHCVTIGGTGKAQHLPIIGNNCKIFTGSIILGECVIGANSVVAAGTVIVNKKFPNSNQLIKGLNGSLTVPLDKPFQK